MKFVPDHVPPAREVTPVVLAGGLVMALNLVVLGVIINNFYKGQLGLDPSMSENATQILTTVFGGIIGVLGSALGYRQATSQTDRSTTTFMSSDADPDLEPPPDASATAGDQPKQGDST